MLRNPNAITVGMMIALFPLAWLMLDGFRKDVKGDLAEFEIRLTERVAGLDVGLTEELAAVESRLSSEIRGAEARLDSRLSRIENRLERILEIP